ncbi:hypothetical protein [Niallia sp. 03133]|uniref:hypothetical protein n=1 Tax=Niallia sp. 03133 TaxID=3458060 RepID=UPI004044CEAA
MLKKISFTLLCLLFILPSVSLAADPAGWQNVGIQTYYGSGNQLKCRPFYSEGGNFKLDISLSTPAQYKVYIYEDDPDDNPDELIGTYYGNNSFFSYPFNVEPFKDGEKAEIYAIITGISNVEKVIFAGFD